MPCDHFSIAVPFSKVDAEVAWFVDAFGPLGAKEHIRAAPGVVGVGDEKPFLWISGLDKDRKPLGDDLQIPCSHVALSAPDRAHVDKVHAAALKAGATCNGKPGLREYYHPNYYGAFFFSPAGHNFEVVCHMPEGGNGQ